MTDVEKVEDFIAANPARLRAALKNELHYPDGEASLWLAADDREITLMGANSPMYGAENNARLLGYIDLQTKAFRLYTN